LVLAKSMRKLGTTGHVDRDMFLLQIDQLSASTHGRILFFTEMGWDYSIPLIDYLQWFLLFLAMKRRVPLQKTIQTFIKQ